MNSDTFPKADLIQSYVDESCSTVVQSKGNWQANLELRFQKFGSACRLSRCRHKGPLYVQKPFYPEGKDLAHIYLLHPPGGLVSGDRLQIDVALENNARALITTPGAGRIYRAREDRALQQQQINLRLAPGATLEWLPQETIVYRGANTRLDTQIDLATGSYFIGWEITSLGLPASGVAFDSGDLMQRLKILCEGQPVLIESLLLTQTSRELYSARAGLQANPINGFFIAGPFQPGKLSEELMASCRNELSAESEKCLTGISQVGNFIVARYLGYNSEHARFLFTAIWSLLRPVLLGRNACLPRIWAT